MVVLGELEWSVQRSARVAENGEALEHWLTAIRIVSNLGIKADDFFSISDYITSSMNSLIPNFVSVISGMIFYFYGMDSRIQEGFYSYEFEIRPNRWIEKYFIPIISFFGITALSILWYKTGEILYPFLILPAGVIILDSPIWKYIKK